MEKEVILVRVFNSTQITEILSGLLDANIECHVQKYEQSIRTKNVFIRFVVIPIGATQTRYTIGLRCVGCFGFDEETTDYLTRGNNVCADYTLINYVKEMNEMGY